jgi:hypothetical protein
MLGYWNSVVKNHLPNWETEQNRLNLPACHKCHKLSVFYFNNGDFRLTGILCSFVVFRKIKQPSSLAPGNMATIKVNPWCRHNFVF